MQDSIDEDRNGEEFVRILLLGADAKIVEHIENALWVWPHKVSVAPNVSEAIKMCLILAPTAIINIIGLDETAGLKSIRSLRESLTMVPIVAAAETVSSKIEALAFQNGADAFITRDDLKRPALYGLFKRIRRSPGVDEDNLPEKLQALSLPWRESRLVGALMCDTTGTVIAANDCLAHWLHYSSGDALIGASVKRDILQNANDWNAWALTLGDLSRLSEQSVTVKTLDQQWLWMAIEIFSAPDYPLNLIAMFMNQSELAFAENKVDDHCN